MRSVGKYIQGKKTGARRNRYDKKPHQHTEHRHEVVGMGPAIAERAPHRGRVHVHTARDDEALRLPGRSSPRTAAPSL